MGLGRVDVRDAMVRRRLPRALSFALRRPRVVRGIKAQFGMRELGLGAVAQIWVQ